MKKAVFFLPAAVHTAATLVLNILSGALIPLWHLWNILFWLEGWCLSRGKVWGCVPGLLPAVMVLWLNHGPKGVETVVALVWIGYYLACGVWAWKKRNLQ